MIEKRYRTGKVLLLILVGLMLSPRSCMKEFPTEFPTSYAWEPVLAFPIGEADFGLKIPHGFDTLLLQMDPVERQPYWNLLDTIPMSGGIGFDFETVLGKKEEIATAIMRINTYNGFPIEIEIQGYLENEFGEVLDTLFFPKLVMSRGVLEAGGKTSVPSHTQVDIPFDSARLELLYETRMITFRGELVSVPYFPEYTFKVQLGAVLGIVSEI